MKINGDNLEAGTTTLKLVYLQLQSSEQIAFLYWVFCLVSFVICLTNIQIFRPLKPCRVWILLNSSGHSNVLGIL